MRRWLRTHEAAALVELPVSTFHRRVDKGDFAGVLSKQVGRERRWCAEALWKAHLQGHDGDCLDLADIRAFVAEHPLPDEERVA